ncbi:biphenyl 2,3-dioxygenase, partial [Priestia megaterium]
MTTLDVQASKWSFLYKAILTSQADIIVIDPSLPYNPIIYLNQWFSLM